MIAIVFLNPPLFSLENSGFFWPQKGRPAGGKARLLQNNDQARFLILKNGKTGPVTAPLSSELLRNPCAAHIILALGGLVEPVLQALNNGPFLHASRPIQPPLTEYRPKLREQLPLG